ncbi:MAG: tyrosine-type recombinase/integrase [Romboutsia sp.]|nr:tyrosine-type recombinase/integrase [Romboutsia sp.]
MEDSNILNDIEFNIFNKFSQKLNPNTKNDYLSKIILMKVYLEGKELLEVTKYDCNDFIDYIKDKYAKSTCEKIYSYLHSFYNFMYKYRYIEVNPFTYVKKPEVSRIKTKDDVLSIQEINQLVSILPQLNIRDRVIMIFLATTGCLLNELVNLKWKDFMVDEKNNIFVRLGKNKKERVVKVHPYCFKLIEDYRNYSGLSETIFPSDEFVFTTQKSNSITDRNVRLIVKKALDLAGLPQYSAKDFRHSFAAISLRFGADEEDIKNQLGWSDKYYAIRYKYVLNFVDNESMDYSISKEDLDINKK